MQVIDFSDVQGITADTTLITADNMIITADATLIFGDAIMKIIPRELVDTVYVTLYNELTRIQGSFSAAAIVDRGYLQFNVPLGGIKEGDSFELTVRRDSFEGELLYRDKAYATVIKDLANYKLNYPDSNGVIVIN